MGYDCVSRRGTAACSLCDKRPDVGTGPGLRLTRTTPTRSAGLAASHVGVLAVPTTAELAVLGAVPQGEK